MFRAKNRSSVHEIIIKNNKNKKKKKKKKKENRGKKKEKKAKENPAVLKAHSYVTRKKQKQSTQNNYQKNK